MAEIKSTSESKVYQIKKWLGLNENPDGDTDMKMGEAAEMRNFKITSENHLQIRPGYGVYSELDNESPVLGMWEGYVSGKHHLVASCGGFLWDITNGVAENKGELVGNKAFFFGFSDKLYILTGSEYYSWDGENAPVVVEGYIPVVATAVAPNGSGTELEGVNLLTDKRRADFSPDGTAKTFQLPDTNIKSVVSVTGTTISYTADLAKGTVTFNSAPPAGVNSIEITWSSGESNRNEVVAMSFAELFNGQTDSRVFLYGNGTNKAIYSGLGEHGLASAEYFPAFNTIAVDSANTPITAMIRHYNSLLIFKPDSAFCCEYSTLTLNGVVVPAFYTSSLNREIGCAAPGQSLLVNNNARTLYGRSVYDWSLTTSGLRDERNAKRISDRVANTLGSFDFEKTICFDDEWRQEYYVIYDGKAVVHNYRNDTWYVYTNFPVTSIVSVGEHIYFGTKDGKLMEFSRYYRNDNGEPIDAYWCSGSMDFEMDWRRKYSSLIWVSIKPESRAAIYATAESNIKSDYPAKLISTSLASFTSVSFAHWSFNTNRKPQLVRAKLKIKKATYYKFVLYSNSASTTATVMSVDFQVRHTGNVK